MHHRPRRRKGALPSRLLFLFFYFLCVNRFTVCVCVNRFTVCVCVCPRGLFFIFYPVHNIVGCTWWTHSQASQRKMIIFHLLDLLYYGPTNCISNYTVHRIENKNRSLDSIPSFTHEQYSISSFTYFPRLLCSGPTNLDHRPAPSTSSG